MTTTQRTRTEEDRKEQILAAARVVFDEKGYEGATVSDIVKRAGVAQGTFYLYFASKRDAVVELARKPMEEIAARMEAAGASVGSFEEMLRAAVKMAFEFERPNMDLCRLITQTHQSSKDYLEATPGSARIHRLMVSMFSTAMDSGEMERMDPEMAAVLFHMMLSGALSEASASRDQEYSRAVEGAVARLLVNAFVKR